MIIGKLVSFCREKGWTGRVVLGMNEFVEVIVQLRFFIPIKLTLWIDYLAPEENKDQRI